jgi:hypothetical protein
LERFKTRRCNYVLSESLKFDPPKTFTSRSKVIFAGPPTVGLHSCHASRSRFSFRDKTARYGQTAHGRIHKGHGRRMTITSYSSGTHRKLSGEQRRCCVKHAHMSQTLLASLYVYRLDSLVVLYIPTYVLHLYKQRSNKTYSCSRLIKLAQATRAQKPASSNMAA